MIKSAFIQGLTAAAIACGSIYAGRASAEVNLDLDIGHRRPVVVQQPAEIGRRWVPETVVRREEKVLISNGRPERREEKVLVEPERIEKRVEKVLVRPATIEKQWVPGKVDEVRIGPLDIKAKEKNGYFREVTIPPVFENRVTEVRIPARYDVRIVEVAGQPRYETVVKDVVIPGHFEEVVVQPPPVVVPGKRSGFDLDIDIGKRR